jgi:hypothetical protein
MSNIIFELERLSKNLKSRNPKNYDLLNNPLSENLIQEYLFKLGLNGSPVEALYKWKNGVNIDLNRSMIFDFQMTMLSLEDAYEYNKVLVVSPLCKEGFVFLFTNGEDSFLFNNNIGDNYGKIHLDMNVSITLENNLPYYDSLEIMIKTTNTLYERNAFSFDEKANFLDSDTQLTVEIYTKLNPVCDFYSKE